MSFIRCLFLVLFCMYNYVQTRNIFLLDNTIKLKSLNICEQFFNISHCYYFACVDSIYQCGEENLLVQFSYPLCEAILERSFQSLTSAGQRWAKVAQTCLMQELNYFLKTNLLSTCSQIDRYLLNRYPICLTQSHPIFSLCSIMCNNLEIFLEIFTNWKIKSLNFKRLFLETSYLCTEKSQMKYVIDRNQSTIRTILWSLCLDSLKIQFENFHPNQLMIKSPQTSGIFASASEEEEEDG